MTLENVLTLIGISLSCTSGLGWLIFTLVKGLIAQEKAHQGEIHKRYETAIGDHETRMRGVETEVGTCARRTDLEQFRREITQEFAAMRELLMEQRRPVARARR